MSLGQLPNPKAANDLLEGFRKRFNSKVCMAPFKDYGGNIVSAHTLSVEAVLRKLSEDSRVYAASHDIYSAIEGNAINITKLGIGDVSVFNGFCAKHDIELFSCIENEPFIRQPQQNFMLCYRAAARECYLKRKQYESIPTPEQFVKIHKLEGKYQDSELNLLFRKACLKGAEEIETYKSTLDSYLLQKDWSHLESHFIVFPKLPCLAASFVFQPFFDMDGTQLQNFANFKSEMSSIAFSLIPYEQGGIAIFSWLDTSNIAPIRFFMSVMQSRNLTSAIIHVVFDNGDNFAVSPEWYEKLPQDTKSYIISRMRILDTNGTYFRKGRPDEASPYLDDWGR